MKHSKKMKCAVLMSTGRKRYSTWGCLIPKIRKGGEPAPPFLAQQFVAYSLKLTSFSTVIYFTASFNPLPAVNLGTFLAAILIALPV